MLASGIARMGLVALVNARKGGGIDDSADLPLVAVGHGSRLPAVQM